MDKDKKQKVALEKNQEQLNQKKEYIIKHLDDLKSDCKEFEMIETCDKDVQILEMTIEILKNVDENQFK